MNNGIDSCLTIDLIFCQKPHPVLLQDGDGSLRVIDSEDHNCVITVLTGKSIHVLDIDPQGYEGFQHPAKPPGLIRHLDCNNFRCADCISFFLQRLLSLGGVVDYQP